MYRFLTYLFFIIIGYLSGSMMYAYLLPRLLLKRDITEDAPDHNPGVANAFMNAGIPVGILVLVCELAKGAIPVYCAARRVDTTDILFAVIMLAPVLGHAFPLYSGFKRGGKGIAVSFGVLIGLFPNLWPGLTLALLYIFFSLVIKVCPHFYRSIVTYVCFCAAILFVHSPDFSVVCGCFAISITVVARHLHHYQGERLELFFGRHDLLAHIRRR